MFVLYPGMQLIISYKQLHLSYQWRSQSVSRYKPQKYWQNRETTNKGLDSSVGGAPTLQSGVPWFESHSSQFFFVQPPKIVLYKCALIRRQMRKVLFTNIAWHSLAWCYYNTTHPQSACGTLHCQGESGHHDKILHFVWRCAKRGCCLFDSLLIFVQGIKW